MKALIFAAGLGTRLKPLTDTMPKAMVPIGGKPLLQHLIEKMTAAGFTELTINVHHFATQIIDFVDTQRILYPHIKFYISDEREQLLDTGGGIKHAAQYLCNPTSDEENRNAPFLVHNVDILNDLNLRAFYTQHATDSLATLLVSARTTSRYLLFDATNRLVGWTNIQTGQVKSPYPNLDLSKCQKYAFAGVHIISPALLPYMEGWEGKFSIIDFYLSICDKVKIMGVPDPKLRMMDVGKIDVLDKATAFLSEVGYTALT